LWLGGLALLTFAGIWWTKLPHLQYAQAAPLSTFSSTKQQRFFLICFFILLSIFIRSFIGFMVHFPRKTGFLLGFIFTFSVIFGKAFGGILADRFGFEKVGMGSLAISAVLLGFCSTNPLLGLLGIFLFNMTMPITLVVLVNTFTSRP
jgi:FSR family fosmidomycin resistance protein-like MFS transporter